ncbi:erythrocyte membrane protein 1, PfEMP1, putative [Plasmodium sp. DRC-Itaito]|nr:erythrocyte membrane protein 1, PfEMP1, putative [Plasmodium sp. DRC-Itaito]
MAKPYKIHKYLIYFKCIFSHKHIYVGILYWDSEGIATQFQNDAKTQLDNDSGNVDEYSKSVLIGKPEQGQYKHNNGNSDNELKRNILGMCTSNLEHLDVEKAQGLQDKEVNHSFTGDVLLTAKEEAPKNNRSL